MSTTTVASNYSDAVTEALETAKAHHVDMVAHFQRLIDEHIAKVAPHARNVVPVPPSLPAPNKGSPFVASDKGPRETLKRLVAKAPNGYTRTALIEAAIPLVESTAKNIKNSLSDTVRQLIANRSFVEANGVIRMNPTP